MAPVTPDPALILWMIAVPILLVVVGIIIGIAIGRRKRDQ